MHSWPVALSSAVGTSIVVRACTPDISLLIFSPYYRGDSFPLLDCAPGHVQLAFTDDASRASLLQALEAESRKFACAADVPLRADDAAHPRGRLRRG